MRIDMPVAAAGWAEAAASDELSSPSLFQVVAFLTLPILFGVLAFLIIQRFAENLLRPIVTVFEIAAQTAYVALAIAALSSWYRLFW